MSALTPRIPPPACRQGDIIVEGKRGLCGFASTNLDFILGQRKIENIALAGFLVRGSAAYSEGSRKAATAPRSSEEASACAVTGAGSRPLACLRGRASLPVCAYLLLTPRVWCLRDGFLRRANVTGPLRRSSRMPLAHRPTAVLSRACAAPMRRWGRRPPSLGSQAMDATRGQQGGQQAGSPTDRHHACCDCQMRGSSMLLSSGWIGLWCRCRLRWPKCCGQPFWCAGC
jgi:hypothetical protein